MLRLVSLAGTGPHQIRDGGLPFLSVLSSSTPSSPIIGSPKDGTEDVVTGGEQTRLKARCARGKWTLEVVPGLIDKLRLGGQLGPAQGDFSSHFVPVLDGGGVNVTDDDGGDESTRSTRQIFSSRI